MKTKSITYEMILLVNGELINGVRCWSYSKVNERVM